MRKQAWIRIVLAGVVTVAVMALLALVVLPSGSFTLRFVFFLAIAGFLLGLAYSFLSGERVDRSRDALDEMLKTLASGNLAIGGDHRTKQAMEGFPGFRRVLRSFQNMIGYLRDSSESVSAASNSISEKTRVLFREVQDEVESVVKARDSIQQLEREIEKVVHSVDGLSSFSEQTGSAVLEMRASIEEVVGSTHNLSNFVEEIGAASVEEFAALGDRFDNSRLRFQ